jgi:concanavalin A-like lectin/glucanase superfamily protein
MSQILLAAFGSPAPANPSGIPNLVGWFKGSQFDATTDGTDVSSWTDVGPVPANAVAIGGAGNRPTVSRNSINTSMTSIANAGLRGLSNSLAFSVDVTWTVFAVLRFTATPASENNFCALQGDGLNTGVRMGINSANNFSLVIPSSGNYFTNETVSINAWHYLVIVSNAGVRSVYLDTTLLTWNGTPAAIQQTGSGLKIFEGATTGGTQLVGKIAECAFFNAAVSSGDRTSKLEAYAQSRFGL